MKKIQINKNLTEEQKKVLFEKNTEPAFSGKFLKDEETGIYHCANCYNRLFSSETKFDAGSGWPSFYQPISKNSIDYRKDISFNLNRTEVICKKCQAHLGHVFNDGPNPTGQRFCVNSLSLCKDKDVLAR